MTLKTHINVTWVLPFIGPFVLLAMIRALVWCAGIEWSESNAVVAGCMIFGTTFGTFAAAMLSALDSPLTIRKWWIK